LLIIFLFPGFFYYVFYFSGNLRGVADQVWLFFLSLSGVLMSNCLAALLNSSFYISGDTSTPSKISSIVFTMFLPLKVAIYKAFGLEAMVVATSVYCLLNLCILLYFHKKLVLDKCLKMN
jgi:peptidoglycan biosynthesis protein MviN/MurJ (putative lipid II flippase)